MPGVRCNSECQLFPFELCLCWLWLLEPVMRSQNSVDEPRLAALLRVSVGLQRIFHIKVEANRDRVTFLHAVICSRLQLTQQQELCSHLNTKVVARSCE